MFSQKEIPLSPSSVSLFRLCCIDHSETFTCDFLFGIEFEILTSDMKKNKFTTVFTDDLI